MIATDMSCPDGLPHQPRPVCSTVQDELRRARRATENDPNLARLCVSHAAFEQATLTMRAAAGAHWALLGSAEQRAALELTNAPKRPPLPTGMPSECHLSAI
jgi:hypothetical protein